MLQLKDRCSHTHEVISHTQSYPISVYNNLNLKKNTKIFCKHDSFHTFDQ